jgi:hypothetical protein
MDTSTARHEPDMRQREDGSWVCVVCLVARLRACLKEFLR